MRKIHLAATGAAVAWLAAAAGPAAAQSNESTYYYCYAYAQDGRVFVTDSVRFGSAQDYSPPLQAFTSGVRAGFGVPYFTASGCRPAYASPDRNSVENERINFIQQERNNGKSVILHR